MTNKSNLKLKLLPMGAGNQSLRYGTCVQLINHYNFIGLHIGDNILVEIVYTSVQYTIMYRYWSHVEISHSI